MDSFTTSEPVGRVTRYCALGTCRNGELGGTAAQAERLAGRGREPYMPVEEHHQPITGLAQGASRGVLKCRNRIPPQGRSTGVNWVELVPRDGIGPQLALGRSAEPPQANPRIHFDLYVAGSDEQRREVSRLVELGARRVDWDMYPDDPDFVVLADPEDNLFCVVDTNHGSE